MVHDSFDEFEVWSLNKSKEGKKKCFHWKIHVGEQSCALGQPSKMEPHEHTQRERPLVGLVTLSIFASCVN